MILILDSQLSDSECNELIEESSKSFKDAGTIGPNIDSWRTAEDYYVTSNTPLTQKIRELVTKHTGGPAENQELISIIRYKDGGQYKPHYDFFHAGTEGYDEIMATGGQRTHTVMFYLNDGFVGGETEFPNRGLKITPRKGRMVVWTNSNEDKSLYVDSLHSGLPVTEGSKYIAIIWVRERPFGVKSN